MLSVPDTSTVDLTRTRLTLRVDVTFRPQIYGTETWYHIELPSKSQFFRIGYHEYVFVSLLDGQTTFSEALALTARTLGASALSQEQALSLYEWLLETDIASFSDGVRDPASQHKLKHRTAGILQKLNPFWIRIPLGRPDAVLQRLEPFFSWIFSPIATVAAVLLMLIAGCRLATDWSKFSTAAQSVFAVDNWLWLLLAWLLLKTVHETAHGLVCRRYGGSVRETGIILAFFAPLAYVDVTSCWRFSSRWQRIHVAAAGMFIELLLASVAVFTWTQVSSDVLSHLLYNIIVMASLSTLLFNANPLMKFDGYYILSDLLQIPNLSSQAASAVQRLFGRVLFGVRTTTGDVTGRHGWLLCCYGIAAIVWRLLICVTMLIAASVLFHGAGVALAIAGVIAWFGIPTWTVVMFTTRLWRTSPLRLVRGVLVATACIVVMGGVLFRLPVPFSTVAPGIVSLPEGCKVRSGVSGFISRIHVRNGQPVVAGDLLLTFRNDEIVNDHSDLLLQIQQETYRRQIAMQKHDAGAASVAVSNLRSLQDRLEETQSQLEALNVYAPTSGVVVADHLEWKLGTYISEGDDLLTVDDQRSREFRISVAQEDFPLAERRLNTHVSVRVGTRNATNGVIDRVIPRASRRVFAASLAATEGGVLSVMAADDDETDVQLTEHRFEAVVRLPTDSVSLSVGERGYATLGNLNESLATHLYDRTERWLKAQIDTATQTR
ncbi:MAG: efflux RND transporter periplasmic adaptor subunit [Planctomycetaceae bacterium]